ncbi:hypothetical protein ACFMPD_16585, partial [Sedimentitalea sp. HM32M-2]|uniref:hypothetical protein n=1 Tax=Sedimentitalea sp. HM32M-2 TaxID=3351566 RepID=UPI0036457F31
MHFNAASSENKTSTKKFQWFLRLLLVLLVTCGSMTHLFAQDSTSQPRTAVGAGLSAQVEVAVEKLEAAGSDTAGLEALAELENLARLGSSVATLIVAEAYVTGRHAERNVERALAPLEPILELKDPSASALAGQVWDDGWTSSSGYQQSTSKAVSYYRAVLEAKPDLEVTSRLGAIELLGKRNTSGSGSDWPTNRPCCTNRL